VRTNDAAIVDELQSRLPFGARVSASSSDVDSILSLRVGPPRRPGLRSFHLLYVDGAQAARSLELPAVVDIFAGRAQVAVAEHARRRLFVHAGVVEWNGAAILMPGRTFTGKSTLTLAFLRAGARYYSDEYAILSANGLVHPFPRPLSIRGPEAAEVDQQQHVSAGRRAIPVAWILLTSYRGGATWRPRRVTPGEAFLSLVANTVSVRRRSRAAFRILHRVVENATALKSVRGEAEEVVAYFGRRLMSSRT
jgi:hypothetical protein